MFYYLYEVKNNLNGKIYVGVHKTKSLDDGYMGSGKVISNAIRKHGIEHFTKIILERFETSGAMYAREKEVVTAEFLMREDVYNLRRGGNGGFDYINDNGIAKFKNKRHTAESKAKMAHIISLEERNSSSTRMLGNSNNKKIHLKGEQSINFGTMWITDGTKSKKIKKTDLVPVGWCKGQGWRK